MSVKECRYFRELT